MIVNENTPKSPAKASTPLLGDASGSGAPPAYAPRAGQAGPSPIGSAQVPYTVYQPAYVHRVGEPAGRRFCKAFLVAFGVWILASALFGSIFDFDSTNFGQYEYPIPHGIDLENCVTAWPGAIKNPPFPTYRYSASTSFDFALPSKTLLLLSKGGLSAGHLKITTSSDVTDKVVVNVVVNYGKTAVRDLAKVCMINRNNGESGVGIFTPSPWRSRSYTERLSFDVELILPRSKSALYINALSTDVSNFSHNVDYLEDINFGEISLKGSNGVIVAKSLAAKDVRLTTSNAGVAVDSLVALTGAVKASNGRISGAYAVSDGLDLQTSNAGIDVTVAVNSSDATSMKNVVMRTSNGALNCLVDLTTTSGKAGAFYVQAETSNAGLTAKIASAPLDSVLGVKGKTSNNRASMTLPSTYEGNFAVTTSNGPVAVQRVNPDEEDPACGSDKKCKSRSRTIHTTSADKRRIQGKVYWDEQNANRGTVALQTSNAPATVYL